MILKRYFSTTGLLFGIFFFALSMTPSLLPRTDLFQGLISGLSLSAGYAIGVLVIWFWNYFQLPKLKEKSQTIVQLIVAIAGLFTSIFFLWKASDWQNSLHVLMEMEEVASVQPIIVGVVTILVFLITVLLARLFRWTYRLLTRKLQRFVPRRVSYIVGLIASFFLFWSIIDGVLFSFILRTADTTYEQIDSLIEPEVEKPLDSMKAGSAESFLRWEDMGRKGRSFLFGVTTTDELEAFTTTPVKEPIRVYVGMHAADSFEKRAVLALEELKRINAFDRKILVIITPTGTGWVDPSSIAPLEHLHHGDVASVAAQYSYLPSPLSLLAEDEYGADMARALFQEVYGYWTQLPENERPKLYLHGLSLGALNSDRSYDLYDIIDDPFHGVFWVGPPFRKDTWRTITNRRNPDSPAWLPSFRNGSVVRFANQHGGLQTGDAPWGSFRIAYLQYASDPITFFEPRSSTRMPEWMSEPRGPDVSEYFRWVPFVTMFQLSVDMISGTEPKGYGHEYAAKHYFDSWLALTEPKGWSDEELERLRKYFSEEFYN